MIPELRAPWELGRLTGAQNTERTGVTYFQGKDQTIYLPMMYSSWMDIHILLVGIIFRAATPVFVEVGTAEENGNSWIGLLEQYRTN